MIWAECGDYYARSQTTVNALFMLLAVLAEETNYDLPEKIVLHNGKKKLTFDQEKWRAFYRKWRKEAEDDE